MNKYYKSKKTYPASIDESQEGDLCARQYIGQLELDLSRIKSLSDEIEQERKIAITDILAQNSFVLSPELTRKAMSLDRGYHLFLSIQDMKLLMNISCSQRKDISTIKMPLSLFRSVVKDYFLICQSYYHAIKNMNAAQIEALDMARRGIHNEGSAILKEALEGQVQMDQNTARRLFTLLCVLHVKVIS